MGYSVPDDLLRQTVKQAVQNTQATGAAIAIEDQGEMICRATVGECPTEVGGRIDTTSGLMGLCASSRMMQSCMNTSDSRADADVGAEHGVRAVIVVPLLHQDHLLGLLAVFSRRPYAFGVRDIDALESLAGRFTAVFSREADSTRDGTSHDSETALFGKKKGHLNGIQKFGICALVVLACFTIGVRLGWKPLDARTAATAKGHVTLISTVLVLPPQPQLGQIVEGTLIHRINPTYPGEALRQGIQGQAVLQARIGKDGVVYDVKGIRGEPTLSLSAANAVREWRFAPYKLNDKPLDVTAQITFDFSLGR